MLATRNPPHRLDLRVAVGLDREVRTSLARLRNDGERAARGMDVQSQIPFHRRSSLVGDRCTTNSRILGGPQRRGTPPLPRRAAAAFAACACGVWRWRLSGYVITFPLSQAWPGGLGSGHRLNESDRQSALNPVEAEGNWFKAAVTADFRPDGLPALQADLERGRPRN